MTNGIGKHAEKGQSQPKDAEQTSEGKTKAPGNDSNDTSKESDGQ